MGQSVICKIIKNNSPEHSIESKWRGRTGMDTSMLVSLVVGDQAGLLYYFYLLRKTRGEIIS